MRAILFGLGNYYKKNREKLQSILGLNLVAATDNNKKLWGQKIEGMLVIPPADIQSIDYDDILIMSMFAGEIYQQLVDLGVEEKRILIWDKFYAGQIPNSVKEIPELKSVKNVKRKILIISQELDYDGGSLAVLNAAIAAKRHDTQVFIAAPNGNTKLINEMKSQGIPVVICSTLPYIFDAEKKWIQEFDVVMVNLFTMIESAYEISKFRPVLWWIHEAEIIYRYVLRKYPVCTEKERFSRINIYSVSRAAQKNFNHMFDDKCTNSLMLGIPDMASTTIKDVQKKDKVVFAVIGSIHPIKLQHIFVSAAMNMSDSQNSEFWIIGKSTDNEYYQKIEDMQRSCHKVKILGELTRKELYNLYPDIDVVVCTSQAESLPTVIIEAMMFGKVCVTTEKTGIAEFIKNGVNGFVLPVENVLALSEAMGWIINNQNKISNIKAAARKTYEKYFTMDIFEKNLEKAFIETMQKWEREAI